MNVVSKQDRVYPRTPSELEQKYNYGKVFEEITGVRLTLEEQEAMVRAELSLKLGYDDNDQIVSMLNASADIITITGNRLTIDSDYFTLAEDGTIHCTAGEIGGCVIRDGLLEVPMANIKGKLTVDHIDTGMFTAKLEEIEGRVVGAEGGISSINTSLDILSGRIESKVERTDFDILDGTVKTAVADIVIVKDLIESKVSQTDFDALGNVVSAYDTRIAQTENDISLRATKTELSSLGTQVAAAEAAILLNTAQIALKVSQTDFNALGNTVSQYDTRITANYNNIQSKVSQSDFNDLGKRVTTAEGSITTLAGQIALKVSQENFDALSGEVTTVKGQLDLKIDADNLISVLNASADLVSIESGRFELTGDMVYWKEGYLSTHWVGAEECSFGDGWNNNLVINSSGMFFGETFSLVSQYEIETGTKTFLTVDNIECAFAKAGGWEFSANGATLTTDLGYLTISVGGIIGTATGGTLLSWSKLKELAG